MSAQVDTARLGYELAIRGLRGIDLARLTKRSPATISAVLAGKFVSITTITAIAEVLTNTPVIEGVVRLLTPPVVDASSSDQPPKPVGGQA
jgi:hypothetical protein